MILFLGDLHGRFEVVDEQVRDAEARFGAAVEAVVALGDFGLFRAELDRFFARDGRVFPRPVHFVEGNHEDFARFEALVRRHAAHFTHIPRGEVRTIAGRRVLGLGGAAYMDSIHTPRTAEIGDDDVDRCLAHPKGAVEIVASHDCPRGLEIPHSPGFDGLRPPGFARGREIAARFEPSHWLFGHHHKWFEAREGATAYHGLAEAVDGYGVLVGDDFTAVVHEARPPRRRSWLARLFGTE